MHEASGQVNRENKFITGKKFLETVDKNAQKRISELNIVLDKLSEREVSDLLVKALSKRADSIIGSLKLYEVQGIYNLATADWYATYARDWLQKDMETTYNLEDEVSESPYINGICLDT